MKTQVKAWFDKNLERLVSRKFLAWGTATGLCLYGVVTSSDWVAVTLVYIGAQGLIDAAVQWKHGRE